MEKKVMAFVEEQQMLEKKDKIIVGVSGGADSICLLFMLRKLKRKYNLSLYVVHVNHGLRGKEADEDARFVSKLCEKLNIECRIVSENIKELALKEGRSIEEMGRIIRYKAFRDELKRREANKIATAHHMDDNAETMMFNLFRGTGIRGLGGIFPKREDIIRPIMCLTREEIEKYLEKIGESYRTDSSNFSDEYTRNKIRHNLMTYVKENIFAGVAEHMFETAKQLRSVDNYLRKQTEICVKKIVQYEGFAALIDKDKLSHTDDALIPYVIACVWEKIAVGESALVRKHLDAIGKLAKENAGKSVHLPNHWVAQSSYYHIIIFNDKENEKCEDSIPIKDKGTIEFGKDKHIFTFVKEKYDGESKKISKATYTKCLDYDKIGNHPVIRTRREHDYIIINSKGEKQSLNRYFINQKVPVKIRDEVPLLVDGNRVLWVVGFRISEDIKISNDTENMLIISRTIK